MCDITDYFKSQQKMLIQSINKGDDVNRSEQDVSDSSGDHSEESDDVSGSEYCPSEESEPEQLSVPSTSSTRKESKVPRYYDDGDPDRFNARIKEWKSKKKSGSRKSKNGIPPARVEATHSLNGGLEVPECIWKNLYRYQKTGVKWLWELHRVRTGGLLGDEMGLGKTVQIIAFLAALSASGELGPSLVVAPASVLHQWVQLWHRWWPPLRVAALHSSGSHRGSADSLIRSLHGAQGILVTTYGGMVTHSSALNDRKWHYVVLDEGHKIRNPDTLVSKAVRRIRTPHRILVTGSPLQNNLQELWSLFDFMSPGLLGSAAAFSNHFACPITQGGYTNATRLQETAALSLATALKDIITPYMLRRTKAQVKDHLKLPEKKEQVLFCNLCDEQKDLYKCYLSSPTVRSILDREKRFGESMRARILVALGTLRKICNHPDIFTCEVDEDLPGDSQLPVDEYQSFGFWKRAGKMVVINSFLKIWKQQGHRALIFTQSRAMICILELFLQQNDYKYLKMDGSTSIGQRQPLINLYNSDDSYLVFLATTRVGGLGVNLPGADRVIIYDPDWNPAVDSQAKERAWRIGQNRDVTIYRLLSAGTIEEKIYQRQIFKQLLSNKVLLDPNQKNYLKTSTLQGLFSFEEPDREGITETTNIFKHTQIKLSKNSDHPDDDYILNGGVSFSKAKMAAMRRLAQRISKNISTDTGQSNTDQGEQEDPRERYKRKRIPPPLPPEEPPVNMVNDLETNANFAQILSELDIANMLSKKEPLDFLKPDDPVNIDGDKSDEHIADIEELSNELEPDAISKRPIETHRKEKQKRKRKRQSKTLKKLYSEENGLDEDEELHRLIAKVKNKKRKSEPEVTEDPDQYVLEKLFAKSGVQSALQHDKVIGLAEREETHRVQSQAQHRTTLALKALRKSRLKSWRW